MKNNISEIPLQKERLLWRQLQLLLVCQRLVRGFQKIFCFDFFLLYFHVILSLRSQFKSVQFFALGYKSLGSCTSYKQQEFSNICVGQTSVQL